MTRLAGHPSLQSQHFSPLGRDQLLVEHIDGEHGRGEDLQLKGDLVHGNIQVACRHIQQVVLNQVDSRGNNYLESETLYSNVLSQVLKARLYRRLFCQYRADHLKFSHNLCVWNISNIYSNYSIKSKSFAFMKI